MRGGQPQGSRFHPGSFQIDSPVWEQRRKPTQDRLQSTTRLTHSPEHNELPVFRRAILVMGGTGGGAYRMAATVALNTPVITAGKYIESLGEHLTEASCSKMRSSVVGRKTV